MGETRGSDVPPLGRPPRDALHVVFANIHIPAITLHPPKRIDGQRPPAPPWGVRLTVDLTSSCSGVLGASGTSGSPMVTRNRVASSEGASFRQFCLLTTLDWSCVFRGRRPPPAFLALTLDRGCVFGRCLLPPVLLLRRSTGAASSEGASFRRLRFFDARPGCVLRRCLLPPALFLRRSTGLRPRKVPPSASFVC